MEKEIEEMMGKDRHIMAKELYVHEMQFHTETTPEEEIILKKIEELNGTDNKKEGVYYIIINALSLIEKEDLIYIERLKLAELLKFLYTQEEKGLTLKGKYTITKNHDIEKKQILDFQKVIIKQLSETYFFIKLDFWETPEDVENFWETRNILNWDMEETKIEVIDFTADASHYLKYENGKPESLTLDKQGIEKIILIEKNRHIAEKRNYIGRLLNWIDRFAKKYGYFDNKINTISTVEACFLYDTFNLIGIIEGDESANNQEKYQYIKKELKKAKSEE